MRNYIYIVVFLFFSEKVLSQINELDSKYNVPPNTIFDSDPMNSNGKRGVLSSPENVIKFSPTMLVRKRVTLFYERHIFENLSINIGVGKAFGADIFNDAFLTALKFDDYIDPYNSGVLLSNSDYSGSLPLIIIGGKFYFNQKNVFNTGFFQMDYRYESVDYKLNQEFISTTGFRGSPEINFQNHNFSIGFGYASLIGGSLNLYHEFFLNIGMKYITYDKVVRKEISNPGSLIIYAEKNGTGVTSIFPSIHMTYVIGFGF